MIMTNSKLSYDDMKNEVINTIKLMTIVRHQIRIDQGAENFRISVVMFGS